MDFCLTQARSRADFSDQEAKVAEPVGIPDHSEFAFMTVRDSEKLERAQIVQPN